MSITWPEPGTPYRVNGPVEGYGFIFNKEKLPAVSSNSWVQEQFAAGTLEVGLYAIEVNHDSGKHALMFFDGVDLRKVPLQS